MRSTPSTSTRRSADLHAVRRGRRNAVVRPGQRCRGSCRFSATSCHLSVRVNHGRCVGPIGHECSPEDVHRFLLRGPVGDDENVVRLATPRHTDVEASSGRGARDERDRLVGRDPLIAVLCGGVTVLHELPHVHRRQVHGGIARRRACPLWDSNPEPTDQKSLQSRTNVYWLIPSCLLRAGPTVLRVQLVPVSPSTFRGRIRGKTNGFRRRRPAARWVR
jgi:hypothetical protein